VTFSTLLCKICGPKNILCPPCSISKCDTQYTFSCFGSILKK
jgi:hypothetical protein